jgi:hypothetical protein
MRSAGPALSIAALALAGCQKEAQQDDIVAALGACGIAGARIERRIPDGTQSDFQVDFGTTESGREQSECMNGHLRAAGLKTVLTFYQDPG